MSLLEKRTSVQVSLDDPFDGDKLGRKKPVQRLTHLLKDVDGPFVLSVNGGWGTGKTTFIDMWEKYLRGEGIARSLTFNAWDNDFVEDPGIAFIDEITEALSESEQFDRSFENAAQQLKRTFEKLAPVLVEALTGGLVREGTEEVVKAFKDQKDAIKEFREELEELSTEVLEETSAPLFLFVDELDRCRPDFAVQLLERVKHLFDVEGIVFVLAVDFEQLQSSIRSLYGAEMDANGYLRRFIDLRYRLPRPEDGQYISLLFSTSDIIEKLQGTATRPGSVKEAAARSADHYGLSLRAKQQLVLRVELALRQIKAGQGLHNIPDFLHPSVPFLISLRMERNEYFEALRSDDEAGETRSKVEHFKRTDTNPVVRGAGREVRLDHVLEAVLIGLDVGPGRIKARTAEKGNRLEDISNMSAQEWGGSSSEKTKSEDRLEGVSAVLNRIRSIGWHQTIGRVIDSVELAGQIDAG